MEVEGPEDPVVFLEQAVNKDASGQESAPGIVPDESSQDNMLPELENRVSHAVDDGTVEPPCKASHPCAGGPHEDTLEVTEDGVVPELQAPQAEAQPPEAAPPGPAVLEASASPSEARTAGPSGPGALGQVQGEAGRGAGPATPVAPESPAKDGSGREEAAASPTGPESPRPPAADTSKAHACSPARPSDLPTRDVLRPYPPALGASVGNILPTTYFAVTPKIGMGKPAITKRKFSPGRPRSKQVGRGRRAALWVALVREPRSRLQGDRTGDLGLGVWNIFRESCEFTVLNLGWAYLEFQLSCEMQINLFDYSF